MHPGASITSVSGPARVCWEAGLRKCTRIGVEQAVGDEGVSSGLDVVGVFGMHDDDPGNTALE